jgi:hypothetical protein
MDNADPEINSMDVSLSSGDIHVDADVRAVRTCVDCGTELKDISLQMEDDFSIDDFEGFKELSDGDKEKLRSLLEEEDESVTIDIDEGDGESNDGGGSRYQKNMIKTTVRGSITVTWDRGKNDEVKFTKNIDLEAEEAASSYDECC